MKKTTLFSLCLLAFISIVFAQNQERLSVHYFDVPDELVEEFLVFNKTRNLMLEEAGFGKDPCNFIL